MTKTWPPLATLAAIFALFASIFGTSGGQEPGAHALLDLVLTGGRSHVDSAEYEPAFHARAALPGEAESGETESEEAESADDDADPADEESQGGLGAGTSCVLPALLLLVRRAPISLTAAEPKRDSAKPLGTRFSLTTRPTRGPPA